MDIVLDKMEGFMQFEVEIISFVANAIRNEMEISIAETYKQASAVPRSEGSVRVRCHQLPVAFSATE